MNRHDLLSYAKVGVRQRLVEMEKEVAALHRSFPDLFIGPPPVFVSAERKSPRTKTVTRFAAAWTPARRKAQSERMKKRMRELHGGK